MSLHQDLIAIRAILAQRSHWTTHANARDANGNSVWPTDHNATCWCVTGALVKTLGLENPEATNDRYNQTCDFLNREFRAGETPDSEYEDFGYFNDDHSHGEVIAWLDRKIEEAATLDKEPA